MKRLPVLSLEKAEGSESWGLETVRMAGPGKCFLVTGPPVSYKISKLNPPVIQNEYVIKKEWILSGRG